MINYKVLLEIAADGNYDYLEPVLETLVMYDVPMSKAVIDLGIALGVMLPGYKCGWSEDNGD